MYCKVFKNHEILIFRVNFLHHKLITHYFSFKNHDYEKNKGPSINEHKNNLETMCFKALLIDPSGLQVLVGTLSLNFQAIC